MIKEELITANDSQVLYEISEEKVDELNQFYKQKEIEFFKNLNLN